MKPESAEHKGKVIMEEKKIPMIVILVLSLLAFVVYAAFMFWLFCPGYCFLFLMVLFPILPFMAFPLARKYPLIIYEQGFDAPLETYRILKGEKRFVPFSDVKKIQPYLNLASSQGVLGYVVSTMDEREIKMLDPMTGGKTYEEGLKKGLGKRWERLYSPEPYGLLDDFNEEKMRKCLSKKRKWTTILARLGILLIIPTLVLIPFIDEYFILFVIFLFGAFIGGPFGIIFLIERNTCMKKYELIARFRPDIARRVKPEKDEVTSVDMARKFGKKDWKRLQKSLSVNPFLIMVIGFLPLFAGMLLTDYEGVELVGFYLFVFGMALLAIAIFIVFLVESKIIFLKSIIEEEHRTGKRIIPDYFVIPKWMEHWLPYRDAPNFTEDEWAKIVENAIPLGEREMAFIIILITSSMLLGFVSLMIFSRIGLDFMGTVLFFTLPFLSLLIMMPIAKYKVISRKLIAYEEETGEKVIPEKYRKRIESAFLHAYRK